VLSAGFFGLFAHAGLLLALHEEGLVPRRVVGVSAGALAGGLWSAGLPIDVLQHELLSLRREEFWDPGLPLGGLLKGRKFADKLQSLLGGPRQIEDNPVPFAAVAHDVFRRRTVVLDRGPLDVAIRASCTVPFMFRPVRHEGRLLVDGGVSDRPGLSAVAEGERTLMHHLPSRSPWRGMYRSEKREPPGAPERMKLVIPELPRVSPSKLEAGPEAFERALNFVRAWLDEPS
jgi:NTE family protein